MKSEELDPGGNDRGQRLAAAFFRAAQAIDRSAVGIESEIRDSPGDAPSRQDATEIRVLRSDVHGAAAAYARRLRDEGVTPERMLVLVKATTAPGNPGLGVRELTNDVVRWSIQAYFAD